MPPYFGEVCVTSLWAWAVVWHQLAFPLSPPQLHEALLGRRVGKRGALSEPGYNSLNHTLIHTH